MQQPDSHINIVAEQAGGSLIHPLHDASQAPRRVHAMDALRGLCVCAMILHHALYDIISLFGGENGIGMMVTAFFHSPLVSTLQVIIAGLFILIAGASSRISTRNIKRGLLCLGCGMVLTVVTGLLNTIIVFGILHFLGVSMILFGFSHNLLYKINQKILFVSSMLLFFFTRTVGRGYVGLFDWVLFPLPDFLYHELILPFLFPFGIYDKATFSSADYFPLLPWFFIFLAGTAIGVALRENKAPAGLYRPQFSGLSKIGRHALVIYLLHQPIIYGILWGIRAFTR